MRRRPTGAVLALALLLLAAGCAVLEPRGDQLFRDGNLVAAERAYVAYLEDGRASGRRQERALYHLGLIHAQPESRLYDPERARGYLERLLALDPASPYSLQAALILDLQLETNRLRDSVAEQDELLAALRRELLRMRSETERIESAATDEEARARRLSGQIASLRQQIDALSAELAQREEELERIKKIDLEDPP